MHQGDGRLEVRILKIPEKLPQLVDEKHTLVHDGAAGKRADVRVAAGLLKNSAGRVESAVEFETRLDIARLLYKTLPDGRLAAESLLPQNAVVGGNLAPAEEIETFLLQDDLEQLFRLVSGGLLLGEEKHPCSEAAVSRQLQFLRIANEKLVRKLYENSHAVSGLTLCVFARTVFQALDDGQSVRDGSPRFFPLDVYYRSDSAVVVLKPGIVQPRFRSTRLPLPDFFIISHNTPLTCSDLSSARFALSCLQPSAGFISADFAAFFRRRFGP